MMMPPQEMPREKNTWPAAARHTSGIDFQGIIQGDFFYWSCEKF